MIRVSIQWTETAKKLLASLPKNVQKGLMRKIGGLRDSDPRQAGKRLVGPLEELRRISYARYRAIFSVAEEKSAEGEINLHVKVVVVAVGMRKEHNKKDIYKI